MIGYCVGGCYMDCIVLIGVLVVSCYWVIVVSGVLVCMILLFRWYLVVYVFVYVV